MRLLGYLLFYTIEKAIAATCTQGQYDNSGVCEPCPPGAACSDTITYSVCSAGTFSAGGLTAISCQTCGSGTFSLPGSASCDACPQGFSCSDKTIAPQKCPTNQYSAAGSDTCTVKATTQFIQLGSDKSASASSCSTLESQARYVDSTDNQRCKVCEAGYACSDASTRTQCSSGTYSLDGFSSCQTCPAGSACKSTASEPIACELGSYSTGGATSCTLCPEGQSCSTTNSAPQDCSSSQYSPEGEASCLTCPNGRDCSGVVGYPPKCASGYKSSGNSCVQCLAGTYCPNPETQTSVTDVGFYTLDGAYFQKKCPAGFACSSTSIQACSTGFYSLAGQTTCTAVPNGYYLPSQSAQPMLCQEGYKSTGGAQCQKCAFGEVCTNGLVSATCSSSQLCHPGSSEASTCPNYRDCSTQSLATQDLCADGTYLSGGSCVQCPAGSTCDDNSATVISEDGFYSPAGKSGKYSCPPGKDCSDKQSAVDVSPGYYSTLGGTVQGCGDYACPDSADYDRKIDCQVLPGYYLASTNSQYCSVCTAGNICPVGSKVQTPCASGTYSYPGASECTPCRKGFYCSDTTKPDFKRCSFGFYQPNTGQDSCLPCPSGQYCSAFEAKTCPDGMYSKQGEGFCWFEPAGKYVTLVGSEPTLNECASGHYKLFGHTSCTICPVGHKCETNYKQPQMCEPGTYQNAEGQTSCSTCASGSYSLYGYSSCDTCQAGFKCPAVNKPPIKCGVGTYSADGATSCSTCNVGHICKQGSTRADPPESLCPAGFYCYYELGKLTVTACAKGRYNPSRGQSTSSACQRCQQGFFCPAGSWRQLICTPGSYCGLDTGHNSDNLCTEGTYLSTFGASTVNECLQCPETYHCPVGSTYPVKCKAGHYCGAGTTPAVMESQVCADGTYGGPDALTLQSECKTCPQGHYCNSTSPYPIPCERGTYQPSTGKSSPSDCLSCDAGKVCPFVGARHQATEIPCEIGSVCDNGGWWNSRNPAPAGAYHDVIGQSVVQNGQPCPARFACPQRTITFSGVTWTLGPNNLTNPMVKCASGHYCPESTTSSTQYPCPLGTYSSATNNYRVENCISCPPGKVCASTGLTAPGGDCPVGYYCPTKSVNGQANPCPIGTYQNITGAKTIAECRICPLGYYCDVEALEQPKACPVGTYGDLLGLTHDFHNSSLSSEGCKACPEGYICPETGLVMPLECPFGSWPSVQTAASACELCPVDYFCDSTLNPRTRVQASQKCADGFVCPEGTPEKPYHVSKYSCQQGYYCVNSTQTACGVGTYQPLYGANSSEKCLPVPAGYFSNQTNLTSFQGYPCEKGYYCVEGATSGTNETCSEGTYRNLTNGASAADCGICPAGYFCPEQTQDPFICPLGYYCPVQTIVPYPCPRGTFGHSEGLRAMSDCSDCWGGRYCSQSGLAENDGDCDAGYYCHANAFTAAPRDSNTTGDVCPAGGYCEIQTKVPFNCKPGFFNPEAGKRSQSDCISCSPGKYCQGSNLEQESGDCLAGYFCTGGSSSPRQNITQPGHYTNNGASQQEQCQIGTYNPYPAQASCITCEAGFYCDSLGMIEPLRCPTGHFCTGGSHKEACPEGTFNDHTMAQSQDQCAACPPGYYCSGTGLASWTGKCDAGMFCLRRATKQSFSAISENQASSGDYGLCPVDHYCPQGTAIPISCGYGFYTNAQYAKTASSDCLQCPAGKYCQTTAITNSNRMFPDQSSLPTGDCSEGYYCPLGSHVSKPSASFCAAGQKCPTGSSVATDCPAGTFQPRIKQSHCITCPAGYYCDQNATDYTLCESGKYCPEGTQGQSGQILCPIGTYNSLTGKKNISDCLPCDPGKYCASTGMTTPSIDSCQSGYYCRLGSPTNTPDVSNSEPSNYLTTTESSGQVRVHHNIDKTFYGDKCRAGFYCPEGTPIPIPCHAGYYCPNEGMVEADMLGFPCTQGFYCPKGSSSASLACTAGHYCPQQASAMIPCPAGSYGSSLQAVSAASCTACPAGKYCPTAAMTAPGPDCDEGYICESGSKVNNPYQGLCAFGKKCAAGATSAVDCVAPEYQDERGRGSCKTCQGGFECTQTSSTACDPQSEKESFYCEAGSWTRTTCPDGTYNVKYRSDSASDCLPCPPSKFCPTKSDSSYSNKFESCPAGQYCKGGDATPVACPLGFYCPAESSLPIPCTTGSFCNETGLSAPKGECTSGYYCPLTTLASTEWTGDYAFCSCLPSDKPCQRGSSSATELECPKGQYCPQGSAFGVACPIGRFRATTLGQSSEDCTNCNAGEYCPHRGLESPLAPCPSGYYCPQGQDSGTEYPCPEGKKCPAGSTEPIKCSTGSFNPFMLQSTCLTCPASRYCPTENMTSSTVCPPGRWCSDGTSSDVATDDSRACYAGTFYPFEGMTQNTCMNCENGKYCDERGMIQYKGAVQAGYYSLAGTTNASSATPSTKCVEGQYCEQGSIVPTLCPPGTYGVASLTGDRTDLQSSCTSCMNTKYCPDYGLSESTLSTCPAGYFCTQGATHYSKLDNSTINLCPAGSYCADGASTYQRCPVGTYQPMMGQSTCVGCPAGYECLTEGLTAPQPCSKGHYCQAPDKSTYTVADLSSASVVNKRVACLAGTYNPNSYGTTVSSCLACPAGKYCDTTGLSEYSGQCQAGFLCVSGSSSATPGYNSTSTLYDEANSVTNGACPRGYTCATGAIYPQPCSPGTYQPNTQQTSCIACPTTFYCPEFGMSTTSTTRCSDRYHCISGANVSKPIDGTTGRLCARGNYCQQGAETVCPAGTYGPVEGLSSCYQCPMGYYCPEGSQEPQLCPNKKFCPQGSSEGTDCPVGTYTPPSTIGLEGVHQCDPCPVGQYCTGGQNIPNGPCDAGFWCPSNASQPNTNTQPYQGVVKCPAGFYCEQGTTLPTPCPEAGTYAAEGSTNQQNCRACEEGLFCPTGSRAAIPCPKGHYCPTGTPEPIPCPRTTYNPATGAKTEKYCIKCFQGYACDDTGISDTLNYQCQPGYYCPKGVIDPIPCPVGTYRTFRAARDVNDCEPCPRGHYCPTLATVTPQICRNGTYCPEGSAEELSCRPGTYCPAESGVELGCPASFFCEGASEYYYKCVNGTYCPPNSQKQVPCPGGMFGSGNVENINVQKACLPCGRGLYSLEGGGSGDGNARQCLDCTPGYVCVGETNSPTPTSNDTQRGYECPKGHYCPLNSYLEIPCPPGTYSKVIGARSLDQCIKCKIGFYSDESGQEGCKKCGPSATTVDSGGATECICRGLFRRFIKSTGSCLCEAGYKPKNGADPEADSASDCEAEVLEVCAPGVEVDIEGKCIEDLDAVCKEQCGEDGGSVVEGTGICQCNSIADVETVCDQACRDSQVQVKLRSDGLIEMFNPVTNTTSEPFDPSTVEGFAGSTKCKSENCQMTNLGKSSDGSFTADYGTNSILLAKAGVEPQVDKSSTRRRLAEKRRRLQQTGTEQGDAVISNPVLCVKVGAVILFDVNPSEKRYPIYLKDSMLNTNQAFDRAPFDEVKKQIESGVQVRMFSYEFTDKGIYVFGDSKDKTKLTVVGVKAQDEQCPDSSANIKSMTIDSLASVGIESAPKLVVPNYVFVVSAFVALLAFNFLFVAGFVWLSQHNSALNKQATGSDAATANIYYDKIEEFEQQQKFSFERLSNCFKSKVDEEEEVKLQKEKSDASQGSVKNMRYGDLVNLLDDFKDEYKVLRNQLTSELGETKINPDYDEDKVEGMPEEDMLDERMRELKDLKSFVAENKTNLREYLGIDDAEKDAKSKGSNSDDSD